MLVKKGSKWSKKSKNVSHTENDNMQFLDNSVYNLLTMLDSDLQCTLKGRSRDSPLNNSKLKPWNMTYFVCTERKVVAGTSCLSQQRCKARLEEISSILAAERIFLDIETHNSLKSLSWKDASNEHNYETLRPIVVEILESKDSNADENGPILKQKFSSSKIF